MATMIALNEEKYREAILYFAERINNPTLGKVKLMKLLYFLDFDHLEHYSTLVTGDQYRALPMGPVPISADRVLHDMQAARLLAIQRVDLGPGYRRKEEYVPLRPYDPKVFSVTELDVLNSVALKWEHHSREEIVHATHGEPPWKFTEPGEIIDPRLVYLRPIQETDEDGATGQEESRPMGSLTVEEAQLRAKGRALVGHIEAYTQTHPEFLAQLQAADAEIDAGHFARYDEEGWHQ